MEIATSLCRPEALTALALAGLTILGCSRSSSSRDSQSQPASTGASSTRMAISSPAIRQGEPIASQYTAGGANISPPLTFANVPADARELVLIVDDPDAPNPDAPRMVWDHWLLYGIPATQTSLPEGLSAQRKKVHPAGMIEGRNSWGNGGYEGPDPPAGKPHRYFFKLYALNAPLAPKAGLDKKALLKAMEGKVIAQAELIGTFGRKK